MRSVLCVVSAGQARVNGGGLGNHPLDGKARLHARQSGIAHPPARSSSASSARIACAIAA